MLFSRCVWQLTSGMQTVRSGLQNPALIRPPSSPSGGTNSSDPRGSVARGWADQRDVAAPIESSQDAELRNSVRDKHPLVGARRAAEKQEWRRRKGARSGRGEKRVRSRPPNHSALASRTPPGPHDSAAGTPSGAVRLRVSSGPAAELGGEIKGRERKSAIQCFFLQNLGEDEGEEA